METQSQQLLMYWRPSSRASPRNKGAISGRALQLAEGKDASMVAGEWQIQFNYNCLIHGSTKGPWKSRHENKMENTFSKFLTDALGVGINNKSLALQLQFDWLAKKIAQIAAT